MLGSSTLLTSQDPYSMDFKLRITATWYSKVP